MKNRITKSIVYGFPASPNAAILGFAGTGCWHIELTIWHIERSDQCRTYLPHNAEGFESPDHPDLIAMYHETEGEMDWSFKTYGNADALAAIAA